MARNVSIWVVLSATLTLVLSVIALGPRLSAEEKNKAVTLLAEAEAIEDLAVESGTSFEDALARLKAKGLGGVAVSESTVAGLISRGYVNYRSVSADRTELWGNASDIARISRGFEVRYGGSAKRPRATQIILPLPPSKARELSIGLDPVQCKQIMAADLTVVARVANFVGSEPASINRTLEWASENGATALLPLGDQVLGRRDNMKMVALALRQLGMAYCSPEFSKLGGDQNMLEFAPDNVIRLHAAQAAELDKLPLADAVERYVRAAKERNMRMLLLRPIALSSPSPLDSFGEFVGKVNEGLTAEGLAIGRARPFSEFQSPVPSIAIAAVSVPVIWFVLTSVLASFPWWTGIIAALLTLASLKLPFIGAICYPVLGFILIDRVRLRSIWISFLIIALCAITGGLAIAATHSGVAYTVRADQFTGVKAAHFAPLLLIATFWLSRLTNMRSGLDAPVSWRQALTTLVVLGALVFMAARTGNDNPAAVSGFELKLRSVLDSILLVRPRTKEFMIGHPLLFVGLGLLIAFWNGRTRLAPGWIALMLTAGAIGTTSIVNTFCHFHTPITLSLMRVLVGLISGGIIGALAWFFIRPWLVRGVR
ncbi:MAG TPA: DUF5693 family protein [Fimbriimonadaceae bacterium]|nr:DUF5693 family protein [Fimbriimonadaceae bacterium]